MTDPRTALTALITEHSALTGARAERLADKIAAEWLPAVDRDALAKALCRFWDEDLVENDASSHSYGAPFPCPPCTAEADAILASGVIADAADVRRQTAEATWDEALRWVRQRAEVTSPENTLEHIDRAEPFNPYRAAREVGGDRG